MNPYPTYKGTLGYFRENAQFFLVERFPRGSQNAGFYFAIKTLTEKMNGRKFINWDKSSKSYYANACPRFKGPDPKKT